jgi:hypothetical protein
MNNKTREEMDKEIVEEFEMNSGTETESYLHFRYSNAPFGYRSADLEDIKDILTIVREDERERVRKVIEGMRKKEYQYEHTFPVSIGLDLGQGYVETIKKGQKETFTHKLDEEEETYNQALDNILQSISKEDTNQ